MADDNYIIEYRLVSLTGGGFEVNEYLRHGWQPYGNVITTRHPTRDAVGNPYEYVQPMVKYGRKPVDSPSAAVRTGRV